MHFPIGIWRTAISLQEHFGIITQMIKTAGGGNLRNTKSSVTQKIAADLHSVIIEERDRGLGQIFLEDFAAFAAAYHAGGGNIF